MPSPKEEIDVVEAGGVAPPIIAVKKAAKKTAKKKTAKKKSAKKLARLPNEQEKAEIKAQIAREHGASSLSSAALPLSKKRGVSLVPRVGVIELVDPDFLKRLRAGDKKIGPRKLNVNKHLYEFTPNEYGAFVTDVPYPNDFAAILSIGAGYRPYHSPDDPPQSNEPEPSRIPSSRATPFSQGEGRVGSQTPARGPARPATPRATTAKHPVVDPALG